MVQWAIIIVIIISLVAGIYGVILLNALRKKYQTEFLNSFFYYHLLFIIFGIYGILGNLLVQQILLKFDLKTSIIEAIAHFFPFLGVPFILAGWYMLLKLSAEIINKRVPQFIAIIYFTITTLAFLIYGNTIQKIPEFDYTSLTQKVVVVFYSVELIVTSYVFIVLLLASIKSKIKSKKIYIFRFALIMAILAVLRAASLQFSGFHVIIGLYYLLLFFAGNLSLVFLTRVYFLKNDAPHTEQLDITEDIFVKYHISKREKQIIEEICKGKTNQQIADELFITLQTVKDHTHNIFKKVAVKNRVQLSQMFNSIIQN
ncbi:MAG: helix-turn-helix transcriptional regulator [Bacteroidales bacterium]|nr:helix-turn-helix transcriptional regulator [Bacteroidales bacterium]